MPYLDLAQESQHRFLESEASIVSRPLTILIVDGHALVRSALSQALASQPEIERIIMAQDYAEAEKQSAHLCPEIIWLDLHIAHADSSAEIGRLRRLAPACRILALADAEDEQEAFAAIMAGAQGYRSKQDVELDEIMSIIHMLCRDEFVLRQPCWHACCSAYVPPHCHFGDRRRQHFIIRSGTLPPPLGSLS
jgi:DNA-binding NarL/FixJ family response regulator